MKKAYLFLFISFLVNGVYSQNLPGNQIDKANQIQLNTITTSVPFLIITPDSRAGALGDAGAAISPDVYSFHWNTSKLAFAKDKSQFGLSYSPWLKQLVDDIHLSYIAGYTKINDRHVVGGSLRYFSLGNITFTDVIGTPIRDFNPNEFEILGGYAFKLTDQLAVGINGKFIYSNLTGGIAQGATTAKPGIAGATDLSVSYFKEDVDLGKYNSVFSSALTIQNIGNKISYTDAATRDFLPTNLRIGTALQVDFDKYNSLTTTFDVNKLLVPTRPFRDPSDATEIISGKNDDVGVVTGILQSFYDAPGVVIPDGTGNYSVEKGSRFMEELREINFGVGLEYNYNRILAARAGFFHESRSKGNRKYLTFGAGIYYSVFGIDVSYLVPVTQNNPLANTVRFSLSFKFSEAYAKKNAQ